MVLERRVEGGAFGSELRRSSWDEGLLLDYRATKRFALVMRVRFETSARVTLLSPSKLEPRRALVRRIGVHFRLAPREEPCPANVRGCPLPRSGLRPPYGASVARPLVVPPGRQVLMQFNFRMGECRFFTPGARRTYNQTTRVRYSVDGIERSAMLDLTPFRITVVAPRAGRCRS